MSSVPTAYAPPASIRSNIFKTLPDAIPPTEELEALHEELKQLKVRTLEKAKKAGDDMRLIEESMRRIKEREKGKAKAVEKVKKERDFTPIPDPTPVTLPPHRTRLPSASSTNSTPLSLKPPIEALRPHDDKKKKKKRKRELEESDAEPDSQRMRKASPLPPPSSHLSHHNLTNHSHSLPPKPQKIPIPSLQPKVSSGPDWSLPPPFPLLPSRPAVPPPPVPGPSRTTDVMDDFSRSKQPSQTQVTTFYTSIEPWIRPVKEEDVGFLEYTADETEPFIVPPLGKHYAEVWAEEDMHLYDRPLPGTAAAAYVAGAIATPAPRGGPLPRWEPSTLAEHDLLTEERGHGPLTERLVSALLPAPDPNGWKGVKAAEEAMEGRSAGGANAAAERDKMTVADLEDRIKDSMRFLGLLDDKRDPAQVEPLDDPICTALRQAQRQLRTVVATNKARRARLADVARDRLGYQEYVELRDALDRNIGVLYAKLQKKDLPKASKKKKQRPGADGLASNGAHADPGALPPCPAMLGLVADDEHVLAVAEPLEKLVRTRRQWVDQVGSVFDQKQQEEPGRIWGIPEKSLFEGIEEEVRREVETARWGAVPSDTQSAGGSAAGSSAGGQNGVQGKSVMGLGSGSGSGSVADGWTQPAQVKMELG